jgi:ABC-2 type transport system ATP-binding protein
MDTVIKFLNVKKRFGKKIILDNVGLEINKGEIFGIIGMSGSGKTTLLNLMIGYLRPTKGDIIFYSDRDDSFKSIFKNPMEVRQTFGFGTQVPSFYSKLTLEENLDHFGALHRLTRRNRKANANKLLELTGLEDARKQLASEISEGMKKRLGIACSLIHNPKVLLLDEPTADLDPILRRDTWKLIKSIHRMGTTVIVASHFLQELEEACDRVGMLHNHMITSIGNPNDLRDKYSDADEILLETKPGNYDKIARQLSYHKRLGIGKMMVRDGRLAIYAEDAEKTLHHIIHIVEKMDEALVNIDVRKPSLSEVFESLYKKR